MANGVAGDCFNCAVALALTRATGDDHANVYSNLDGTWIEVWSRHIRAPYEVVEFISHYDQLPRHPDGRPVLNAYAYHLPKPFSFELPGQSDPEWQELCQGCEHRFGREDLDDEGLCEDCRETD